MNNFLQKNHRTLIIVGVLAALQIFMFIPLTPVAIPPMILLWLGVAYLILPQFFRKYRIAILFVYGMAFTYFLVFRRSPNYMEIHHTNFVNFVLLPIPVFITLWVYEQWRWLKTLKADKAKAELALLKSQINPHFFFNTLNNLYGLVVEKSENAPEVVLKLSEMMHFTIYEGREDFVPLVDEVTYLENYIELHKIRFEKKVDISFTKKIIRNYDIAPLLFIILLENAFKHGVERMTEGAYVRLDLTAELNQITFDIENNFEAQHDKKPKGIGLENLKKRLEHIYSNRHQLQIEEQASIYKVHLTINLS